MALRSLDELVNVERPAWPWVQEVCAAATVDLQINPSSPDAADCLLALQVTVGSTLGALALHTGGMKLDHGWLRVLGGPSDELADLASANGLSSPPRERPQPGQLLVGYDVLGGRFAVNGGALPGEPGEVHYWGPDSLEWQSIGAGHSGWIEWALRGGLTEFYASLRWPGWETETAGLNGRQGISVYPPPFTREGQDISSASRRAVSFDELLAMYDEFERQLRSVPPGEQFKVNIVDE